MDVSLGKLAAAERDAVTVDREDHHGVGEVAVSVSREIERAGGVDIKLAKLVERDAEIASGDVAGGSGDHVEHAVVSRAVSAALEDDLLFSAVEVGDTSRDDVADRKRFSFYKAVVKDLAGEFDVGLQDRVEGRGVDRVARNGGDSGSPARKGEGVVFVRGLRGRRAVIRRDRARDDVSIGLEDGAVVVLPRDRVGRQNGDDPRILGDFDVFAVSQDVISAVGGDIILAVAGLVVGGIDRVDLGNGDRGDDPRVLGDLGIFFAVLDVELAVGAGVILGIAVFGEGRVLCVNLGVGRFAGRRDVDVNARDLEVGLTPIIPVCGQNDRLASDIRYGDRGVGGLNVTIIDHGVPNVFLAEADVIDDLVDPVTGLRGESQMRDAVILVYEFSGFFVEYLIELVNDHRALIGRPVAAPIDEITFVIVSVAGGAESLAAERVDDPRILGDTGIVIAVLDVVTSVVADVVLGVAVFGEGRLLRLYLCVDALEFGDNGRVGVFKNMSAVSVLKEIDLCGRSPPAVGFKSGRYAVAVYEPLRFFGDGLPASVADERDRCAGNITVNFYIFLRIVGPEAVSSVREIPRPGDLARAVVVVSERIQRDEFIDVFGSRCNVTPAALIAEALMGLFVVPDVGVAALKAGRSDAGIASERIMRQYVNIILCAVRAVVKIAGSSESDVAVVDVVRRLDLDGITAHIDSERVFLISAVVTYALHSREGYIFDRVRYVNAAGIGERKGLIVSEAPREFEAVIMDKNSRAGEGLFKGMSAIFVGRASSVALSVETLCVDSDGRAVKAVVGGNAGDTAVFDIRKRLRVHIVRLAESGFVCLVGDRHTDRRGAGTVGIPRPHVGERAAVESFQRVDLFAGERPVADGMVAAVAAVDIMNTAVGQSVDVLIIIMVVRLHIRPVAAYDRNPFLAQVERSVAARAGSSQSVHIEGVVQLVTTALEPVIIRDVIPRSDFAAAVRHIVRAARHFDKAVDSERQMVFAAGQLDIPVIRVELRGPAHDTARKVHPDVRAREGAVDINIIKAGQVAVMDDDVAAR